MLRHAGAARFFLPPMSEKRSSIYVLIMGYVGNSIGIYTIYFILMKKAAEVYQLLILTIVLHAQEC